MTTVRSRLFRYNSIHQEIVPNGIIWLISLARTDFLSLDTQGYSRTGLIRPAQGRYQLSKRAGCRSVGDYPLHFHYSVGMANDLGDKFGVVDSCSFHHNFNKSIVVHQTESVEVTSNVSYHTLGRAYYLADGLEHGRTLNGNIGISTLSTNSCFYPWI